MSKACATIGKSMQLRRTVIASMSGIAIEWYDFAVYATAATLVSIKRIPYVLDRDFAPRFSIALAEKDLCLAIQMAHAPSSPMSVAAGVHQIYEQAIARGLAGEDQVAAIKFYEPPSSPGEGNN